MRQAPLHFLLILTYALFMIQPTESQLEIAICHALKINRVFFWKNPTRGYFDLKRKVFRKDYNPYTKKGVPDIIAIIDGRFVGFEVKTKTGRLSPEQKEFQKECKKNGGLYFVIRSVDDVLALIAKLKLMTEQKLPEEFI